MDKERFKHLIQVREETDDEWDAGIEKCHRDILAFIGEDMEGFIDYLQSECTADEFSWLSEMFDDIAKQSHNHRFIDALRFLAQKYPEEARKYHIVPFIDSAEGYIKLQ